MFSLNPYTRRRQQLATGFATVSGVAMVLLLLRGIPAPQSRLTAGTRPEVVQKHFSARAVSPDGTRQAELYGPYVVLRDRQTQKPLMLYKGKNLKGVCFSPDGRSLQVRSLELSGAFQGGLPTLSDKIVNLNPTTGKVLNP